MNCYVCGFPRPEGAKYCPGCGRYCADDPNVRQTSAISPEDKTIEETVPESAPEVFEESTAPEEPVIGNPLVPEEPPVEPEPPHKKRTHRPVLIPVLIMTGLFLVGSACRFLIPRQSTIPEIPTETRAPGETKEYKIPLPGQKSNRPQSDSSSGAYEPTDEQCFRINNGIVSFIPERYDGSPVLVIPAEIDGQTVTGIDDEGFRGLEDVTTLVLPDTLETIGDFAFAHCQKLRGVYIPDSVTSIGEGAFLGCIDMESVSIPEGTAAIGADAFDGCASLVYLFYEGTHEQWMALYNEYITPFTYAICSDGDYYHGVDIP